MNTGVPNLRKLLVSAGIVALLSVAPASAQPQAAAASCAGPGECLCDNSFQDCRAPLLKLIQDEPLGIDVSYWFLTDWTYRSEIIKRWNQGLPVRIIMDSRADANYPVNKTERDHFVSAGIPIRECISGAGINHWKAMIFDGLNKVQFSKANYSDGSFSPSPSTGLYTRYVDEAIYFTDDSDIVNSFRKKYDDHWTDTTNFRNFANITGPLTRRWETLAGFPVYPDLNFVPDQHFENRLRTHIGYETQRIDAAMFRITSATIPDALIAKHLAGVPVRLITDERQYRNPSYFWHAYNLDRMYMAGCSEVATSCTEGIPIKFKNDVWQQDMHQASTILYSRALAPSTLPAGPMAVFGSSNWTSSSSVGQREHNYFVYGSKKPWIIEWFIDQFERKWNNTKVDGTPIGTEVYVPFAPVGPEAPVYLSPADQALGIGSSVTLRWEGGYWAHKYDIYVDTTTAFTAAPIVANYRPGSATAGVVSTKESYTVSNLLPGTTYYWRVVSKTMANKTRTSPSWSFTTDGGVAPPPAPGNLAAVAVSPTRIDLTWGDVPGEAGYKIERKLATASSTAWVQIATTGAGVVTYQNTSGLTPSTSYNYRVRAWTTGGNSGYSNTATATTLASSPGTARIVADAYVRAGQYANTNYGTAVELVAKSSADSQYRREAYLTLDISGLQSSDKVELRLSGRLSDTRSESVTTQIYAVSNTSWVETDVNWNNKPAASGASLGSILVAGTSAKWYSVDLTSYAQARFAANASKITIALINPPSTLHPYISFASRESGTPPELVISPPTPGGATGIVEDAYVRDGQYANTKYGTAVELVAKFSADSQYRREAYLMLDISGVQPGDTVRLRLSGRLSDTRAESVTTNIYAVGDTSWDEESLTWNNKPAATGASLGTIVVKGTTASWYEVDLTAHVQAQKAANANATRIAIALKNPDNPPTLPYSSFGSRESGSGPQLVISD